MGAWKYLVMCGRRGFAAAVAAFALAGCGPSSGELIPPGGYEYTASHATPSGEDRIALEGVLQIDSIAADTIVGHWEVPQLHPELELTTDESGGIALVAHPTYFGTIIHEIRRTPTGFACSGEYVWLAEDGLESSIDLSCTIRAIPPPLARL